ncbi:MAG: hypothetical protein ABI467_23070 [Kofleriaceae bacterium]
MHWFRAIWLGLGLVCGCGRVGFDPIGPIDAPSDAPAALAWVKVFGVSGQDSGTTDTITGHAEHAGDAIVVHAYCGAATMPTAVTLEASGWTFAQLNPIAGSPTPQDWAAGFGAIAPDTATTTFTVTWTVASCGFGLDTLSDELTNNDPTGGSTTFPAHAEAYGTGDCVTQIPSGPPGDMIWAGCSAGVLGTGPGFSKGADDGGGNWTEYRVTTGPVATIEPISFTNQPGHDFIVTAVTVHQR